MTLQLSLVDQSPADILNQMLDLHPELSAILADASAIRHNKAVEVYQAAVLYHLAKSFAGVGAQAFEIGTARGYSASAIAQGIAPGRLTTITPDATDHANARINLHDLTNVQILMEYSTALLPVVGVRFDLIFVDGDHKRVRADFPYFNHIRPGGLIVFHDYSPETSVRACPPVYEGLNLMRERLGRDFDVLVVDSGGVGMAGFVRRTGEEWVDGD